jgi:hypothetical protein
MRPADRGAAIIVITANGSNLSGVVLDAGGTVTNSGSIEAKGTNTNGIALDAGGTVTNYGSGTISGGSDGVLVQGAAATVNNSGDIYQTGPTGNGVLMTAGGTVNNYAGAKIGAQYIGVQIDGGLGAVTNAGSIQSYGTHSAIHLGAGGNVNNSGTIIGGFFGVYVETGAGTVVNTGTIRGPGKAVYIKGGTGSVANAGTISGGTASVEFTGSGANTLTLETGSVLTGAAIGSTTSGATNVLVPEGTGTADNVFENFNTLYVEASADWTLGANSTFGGLTVSSGASLDVAGVLTIIGTASLGGTTSGAGTLDLAGGSATIESGAKLSLSYWSISGAGTDVTLDENLTYAGTFSEGAGDTFVLSGGHLLLSGTDTFGGGTVDGSSLLETEGTTTVSGLTIGGTVEWENTKSVTESGGSVTIGDSIGDKAILDNTAKGTYDIADDSGIDRGSSKASDIKNAGLFEKTGGTGTSTITPAVTNTGTLEVTSGTLDFKSAISGTGKDEVSGAAKLELAAKVAAGQTASFTGSGGELILSDPAAFAGLISGFDTAGAGSDDTIRVASPWVFTGFSENAGATQGDLGFANGSTTISLTLIGDYNPADFVDKTGPKGSTLITYT